MGKWNLWLRKVGIAAFGGAVTVLVLGYAPLLDAIEAGDWGAAKAAGVVLLAAIVAGAARGVIALFSAFVPSDGQTGKAIVGAFKPVADGDAKVVITADKTVTAEPGKPGFAEVASGARSAERAGG